ncbi:MAG: hypothetical protein C0404_12015 [Verrucomicrobia bacterium]|nr:hypothetical protein [Verrucomicrobiota bacterium]
MLDGKGGGMKITLIDAGHPTDSLAWNAWKTGSGRFGVPSVGLVSLASLSRPGDEVSIIDEKTGASVDKVEADLVGISFKTMYARRAYELADSFRARGTPVVLGGLHASLCPDEAGLHADIVVAGEGEAVWPQILEDVENGNFKKLYSSPQPPPAIDTLPVQKLGLLRHESYFMHGVQSARGCSLDCEFCPTRAMFGAGFRLRNPDAVCDEVESLLKIEDKPVLFTDDVFGAGNTEYIEKLTGRLKATGARYGVICDLKMVTPGIVAQLAGSGCRVMCINMPGTCSPEEAGAIKAIQAQGIAVWGYFMFGFEFHKPDVFPRTIEFVRNCAIKHVSLTILAPYPGTPMGERLAREGRIISRDLSLYDQAHVVFKPANMTPAQLENGFSEVVDEMGNLCKVDHLAGIMGRN